MTADDEHYSPENLAVMSIVELDTERMRLDGKLIADCNNDQQSPDFRHYMAVFYAYRSRTGSAAGFLR